MGTSHEVKVGFEIDNNETDNLGGGYPGNFYVNYNYNTVTVDWNGDGKRDIVKQDFGIDLRRVYISRSTIRAISGNKRYAWYFSDEITWNRFTFSIGLRWDKVDSYYKERTSRSLYLEELDLYSYKNYHKIAQQAFTSETIPKLAALLPDNHSPRVDRPIRFLSFSIRGGLTYDLFGDGKTIAKLGSSLYPGGALGASYWAPGGLVDPLISGGGIKTGTTSLTGASFTGQLILPPAPSIPASTLTANLWAIGNESLV